MMQKYSPSPRRLLITEACAALRQQSVIALPKHKEAMDRQGQASRFIDIGFERGDPYERVKACVRVMMRDLWGVELDGCEGEGKGE